MRILAFEIIEQHSNDWQMKRFLAAAVVVILLSLILIAWKKWLTIPLCVLAVVSASGILKEVRQTWVWSEHKLHQRPDLLYLLVAIATAIFPFVAILALLMTKKRRPN